ncbi:hypothetical protein J7E95_21345, partial [Streptomyces sp. ISL-14]|nr:hypothetical protein [Streptomyces sp. ISL-14]
MAAHGGHVAGAPGSGRAVTKKVQKDRAEGVYREDPYAYDVFTPRMPGRTGVPGTAGGRRRRGRRATRRAESPSRVRRGGGVAEHAHVEHASAADAKAIAPRPRTSPTATGPRYGGVPQDPGRGRA